MKQTILRYAVQLVLITLTFQLGAQRTSLFNYLNKQNTVLSSSEQAKFNQFYGSGDYIDFEYATLSPISTSFIKQTVVVNLPNKTTTFKIDRATTTIENNFYWMGTPINNEEGGVFTLSYQVGAGYIGSINFEADQLFYQIFPLSTEKIAILQVKPDIFKNKWTCGVSPTAPEIEDEADDELETRASCPTRDIRILFLFTKKAAASGLTPNTVASAVIAELNTTAAASGVPTSQISFTLAGTLSLSSFIESANIDDDIDDLVNFPLANTLRANNFADLVVLLTNEPLYTAAGIAADINTNFDNAYAIAQIRPASTGFTATHEVGHLLGARHQRCSTCGGIWGSPLGFNGCDELTLGHGFKVGPSSRTIMYQNGCDSRTRIGRWSNPDVTFAGSPTGNYWNKNSRKLRNNAGKVSCFFGPPPVINNNMIVRISGPNGTSCGGGIWNANISNNSGTPPYTYVWELSENGISGWSNLYVNSQSITEEQIIDSGPFHAIGCGEFFYLRVKVYDSSSPQLTATNSRQLVSYCCIQDGNSEPRSLDDLNNVKLFPNPTTGYFYYALPLNNQIKIYNSAGQIQNIQYERIAENYVLINLSNSVNGLYIIRETDSKNNLVTNKLVKI